MSLWQSQTVGIVGKVQDNVSTTKRRANYSPTSSIMQANSMIKLKKTAYKLNPLSNIIEIMLDTAIIYP